jgi:hypothetical protein
MHEIATQSEYVEEYKQPATNDSYRETLASESPLTAAHINALSACLTAIDGIFEVFLSLDVHSIRCLPVFNFVRVAYAVVVLIKMYFAASSSKSELGKVINKDNMKVEQHLENLLERFRLTAAEDRSRPAAKFLVVLIMLRSWFQKQSQTSSSGKGSGAIPGSLTPSFQSRRSSDEKETATIHPQQTDYSTTANTPLQLLSEVATNDSAANSTVAGATPRPDLLPTNTSQPWFNRPQPTSFMYDATDASATGGAAAAGVPQPMIPGQMALPWLNETFNGDFDYALGDGFAQAMDLTLGGIADGGMFTNMTMENSMRYVMQEPSWFQVGGPTLDSMNTGGPGSGFPF